MKTNKISLLQLTKLAVAIFLFAALYSCGGASESQKKLMDNSTGSPESYAEKSSALQEEDSKGKSESTMMDSVATTQQVISSSAAMVSKDTSRKFIRTADLKFRVKDVRWATLKIEDIIGAHNGFVTYTELRSEQLGTQFIPYSEDSAYEIIHFRVENDMTLRVPNNELDSTIRAIGKLAQFLDYRIIKAKDVRISLKQKQLAMNRLKVYDKRLANAIDNKGNHLSDISQAEENKLNRQTESDNNLIDELTLKDSIDYSTIQLNLYQRASTMKTIVESEKEIKPFRTGFSTRFVNGLHTGWKILEFLVLAIVNAWSLLLIIGVTLFTVRYFYRRGKKQK